jgi:hypothetical protein
MIPAMMGVSFRTTETTRTTKSSAIKAKFFVRSSLHSFAASWTADFQSRKLFFGGTADERGNERGWNSWKDPNTKLRIPRRKKVASGRSVVKTDER